jgi:hypothetical protein
MVVKPDTFCNPVDNNGSQIKDPTAHLTCFKVRSVGRFDERRVNVRNQFVDAPLDVKKPKFLCVPTAKNPTTTTPTDN